VATHHHHFVSGPPDEFTLFVNAVNNADKIAWARHCWILHEKFWHEEWKERKLSV